VVPVLARLLKQKLLNVNFPVPQTLQSKPSGASLRWTAEGGCPYIVLKCLKLFIGGGFLIFRLTINLTLSLSALMIDGFFRRAFGVLS
jgi:hypothetical protein